MVLQNISEKKIKMIMGKYLDKLSISYLVRDSKIFIIGFMDCVSMDLIIKYSRDNGYLYYCDSDGKFIIHEDIKNDYV